jgi:AmpE protein
MTIIAILLAFTLCHFVRELGRCRQYHWLKSWVSFASDSLGRIPGWQGAMGFFIVLAAPLALLLLINQVLYSALGSTGAFLLAIAVLVYSFGPKDLDTEVAAIIDAEDEAAKNQALSDFFDGSVPEDPDVCRSRAVERVFQKALCRWFGIIFWFAVLGIAGAFLYRMVDWLVGEEFSLTDEQQDLFRRLQQILDWPAAQLMTFSLAIATDFDSVFSTWKRYHDEQGHGLFDGNNGFLLASACSIVLTGHAARDGYADQLDGPMKSLRQAMDLVWRILGVWMTVLALLLLVGVIT